MKVYTIYKTNISDKYPEEVLLGVVMGDKVEGYMTELAKRMDSEVELGKDGSLSVKNNDIEYTAVPVKVLKLKDE